MGQLYEPKKVGDNVVQCYESIKMQIQTRIGGWMRWTSQVKLCKPDNTSSMPRSHGGRREAVPEGSCLILATHADMCMHFRPTRIAKSN